VRRLALASLAIAAILLAGCGTTAADHLAHAHKDFRAGCIGSSTKRGMAATAATRLCGCIETAVFAGLSESEAVTLDGHTPPQALKDKAQRLIVAAAPKCA
jgi:DNA-binding LacI/PurR family transcriptional regulator